MSIGIKGMDGEDNSSVVRKLRRRLTGCSFCPPHDRENYRKRPKEDKYKNKDRYAIKSWPLSQMDEGTRL